MSPPAAEAFGGQAERRFRIGLGVGPQEAAAVRSVLAGRGWSPADRDNWCLAWHSASDEPVPAGERVVVGIPGSDVLGRKDIVLLCARWARRRRGMGGERLDRGIPETYGLPGDEEALEAAMGDPARRWRQRPVHTVADSPSTPVDLDLRPERSSLWVVQEEVPPLLVNGRPCVVRAFGLVVSLEPIVAYLMTGEVRAPRADADGGDRWHLGPTGSMTDELAAVDHTALQAAIGGLLHDVLTGSREMLLRRRGAGHAETAVQPVGLTVVLDEKAEPWLLEVDTAPFEPVDAALRKELVTATLDALEVLGTGSPAEAPATIGPFVRVVPGGDPAATASSLAYLRPAERTLLGAGPDTSERPLMASGVRWWPVGTQVAIYLPRVRALLLTNETAGFVWIAWCEGLEPDAIAKELAAAFGQPVERTVREIENLVGEWVDLGALRRPGSEPLDALPVPEPLRVGFKEWNVGAVYHCLGAFISVRCPSHRVQEIVDRGLPGLRRTGPGPIGSFVEVLSDGRGGWSVSGTHHGPLEVATEHQLPAAVRRVVLATAARVGEGPAFVATALVHDDAVAVVVGPEAERAALTIRWVGVGGEVLADNLVSIGADLRVAPARVGFATNPDYQWIDGTPPAADSPEAPLVDLDGAMVRYWSPAPTTVVRSPAAASLLVVLAGEAPMSAAAPAVGLGAVLAHLPAGSPGLFETGASRLVEWASRVPGYRAPVADLRGLVEQLVLSLGGGG